eukprot:TRINITY_DN10265_c0_g1_i1.p1 TRINITY_DN10265_c0_g1~~TRINITY_DN10265_c0_g1_i1.p1  ORF type:complete len:605 (-),score=175.77 TRINITY_DN10265_c0_g1_i1:311-1855(-)
MAMTARRASVLAERTAPIQGPTQSSSSRTQGSLPTADRMQRPLDASANSLSATALSGRSGNSVEVSANGRTTQNKLDQELLRIQKEWQEHRKLMQQDLKLDDRNISQVEQLVKAKLKQQLSQQQFAQMHPGQSGFENGTSQQHQQQQQHLPTARPGFRATTARSVSPGEHRGRNLEGIASESSFFGGKARIRHSSAAPSTARGAGYQAQQQDSLQHNHQLQLLQQELLHQQQQLLQKHEHQHQAQTMAHHLQQQQLLAQQQQNQMKQPMTARQARSVSPGKRRMSIGAVDPTKLSGFSTAAPAGPGYAFSPQQFQQTQMNQLQKWLHQQQQQSQQEPQQQQQQHRVQRQSSAYIESAGNVGTAVTRMQSVSIETLQGRHHQSTQLLPAMPFSGARHQSPRQQSIPYIATTSGPPVVEAFASPAAGGQLSPYFQGARTVTSSSRTRATTPAPRVPMTPMTPQAQGGDRLFQAEAQAMAAMAMAATDGGMQKGVPQGIASGGRLSAAGDPLYAVKF